MMYTLPDETVTFTFEGTKYAGAEVTVRLSPVPIAEWVALLHETSERWTAPETLDRFARVALVDWNLSDRDCAIPCTADGLSRVNPDLVAAIIREWLDQVVSVPRPFVTSSNGTGQSDGRSGKTNPPPSGPPE